LKEIDTKPSSKVADTLPLSRLVPGIKVMAIGIERSEAEKEKLREPRRLQLNDDMDEEDGN